MKRYSTIPAVALLASLLAVAGAKGKEPSGTSAGAAIGNGVRGFFSALFPSGTSLLTLIQGWLTKKLDKKQADQVTKAADARKANPQSDDPEIKKAMSSLQGAAKTLELTSILLYHTNQANAGVKVVIAMLSSHTSPKIADSEFNELRPTWNKARGALDALYENSELKNARSNVVDSAVQDVLLRLDDLMRGPEKTAADELAKTGGNRKNVVDALTEIESVTRQFNSLGVVLLGSTGTEIERALSDIKVTGGASELEQMALQTVENATHELPSRANATP